MTEMVHWGLWLVQHRHFWVCYYIWMRPGEWGKWLQIPHIYIYMNLAACTCSSQAKTFGRQKKWSDQNSTSPTACYGHVGVLFLVLTLNLITRQNFWHVLLASLSSAHFLSLRILTGIEEYLLWMATSSIWWMLSHTSFTISKIDCLQYWKTLTLKQQTSTGWSRYQLSGSLGERKWCGKLDTWLVQTVIANW